jgi:hypothetical protein
MSNLCHVFVTSKDLLCVQQSRQHLAANKVQSAVGETLIRHAYFYRQRRRRMENSVPLQDVIQSFVNKV